MRTIIIYATKHGAAGEIAKRIAEKIEGAAMHDLKKDGIPALDNYDCIIIGSSIYAGRMLKEAKEFVAVNMGVLQGKKLGLYLSGLDSSGENGFLETNFPSDLLQKAKAASFLGGIFDPKKAGAFERLIIKLLTKKSEYLDSIDSEKIDQFVKDMQS